MNTWDVYRGGKLIIANAGTEEMMQALSGAVKEEDRVTRAIMIRPAGSPVIGRVERVEDTFRCPACALAVHVGDVFVAGNDSRRSCSVFCQRQLTKRR